jgi:RNA polymerase sigma-70 factor (ECF subfamily)
MAVAAEHPNQARILGDLLHANNAKTPVSEKVWRELVYSIGQGDQHALGVLYQQTHRLVFTLMVRITGNRATAEELTLDVFHDVWRRASAYNPAGGSVVGWIMNQARSRAIDRMRFEQRKKRVNNQAESPLTVTERGPCETFDAREQGRLMRHALEALTPQERQAIETAFFSEQTYGDVAVSLNLPIGTVKTRIRSGLAKLRRVLAETLQSP